MLGLCLFPRRDLCGAKPLPSYLIMALTVACALFMETLDATVIATSLPVIAKNLHQDPISLKLALTSYLISLAIFIPVSGWVADRFGARYFPHRDHGIHPGVNRLRLRQHMPELVAGRMVQGLGGAMMVPVGRLLLLRSVERADLVRALSYLTVPALLGPVVGPLLGGFITTYFDWRWIFWINAPIGVLGIVLATIFIENVKEDNPGPLDATGFLSPGRARLAPVRPRRRRVRLPWSRVFLAHSAPRPAAYIFMPAAPSFRCSTSGCSPCRPSARALREAPCFVSGLGRCRFCSR